MEYGFDVFYCTVCHICKNPPAFQEAKFCSNCKLVQYCCSSHQKEDWPNHKELCKCMKEIVKKAGTNHVFEEATGLNKQSRETWNELRVSVINLAELVLRRSLTFVETQILLFPPVCNFCYRYQSNKMISCYNCNTVMYCCLEHQMSDEKHKDVCKLLFLSLKIDLKRFFLQNGAYNFKILNDLDCNVFKQFPECMESIFKPNCKRLSSEESLLSEPLSYSLTLAFVINSVAKITDSNITVHIVGADSMELFALNTLPVLLNLLPHITSLKIVLIGPNLSCGISVPSNIKDKCSILIERNVLYHNYVNRVRPTGTLPHPDVIAVFNCGFSEFLNEPEKDNWKNSLPCILNFKNSTVLLTSYTEKESASDLERLCQVKQVEVSYEILMEAKLNPFGSFYPHRDWESQNGDVFYANKYISVLKTKLI